MLQIEVGAMLVGRINNHPMPKRVARGEEKGFFSYGGSTILMLFEAGAMEPDPKFARRSARDLETPVRMGEPVGFARYVP